MLIPREAVLEPLRRLREAVALSVVADDMVIDLIIKQLQAATDNIVIPDEAPQPQHAPVLRFWMEYRRDQGINPTLPEAAEGMGMSPSGVYKTIRVLWAGGWLSRASDHARNYSPTYQTAVWWKRVEHEQENAA